MLYTFGYARVSTSCQSIDRQTFNIRTYYPTAKIIEETGHRYELSCRPRLNRLINKARRLKREGNDVRIIFDAVDRFGSDDVYFNLYLELFYLDIELIFFKGVICKYFLYKRKIRQANFTKMWKSCGLYYRRN